MTFFYLRELFRVQLQECGRELLKKLEMMAQWYDAEPCVIACVQQINTKTTYIKEAELVA